MINKMKPVLIAGVFMTGISTASASTSDGLMMEDFEAVDRYTQEDRGFEIETLSGWRGGSAGTDVSESEGESKLLPKIKRESNGNHYFEFKSFGNEFGSRSGPNRRMAFFNNSSVHGDYTGVSSISADFKAESSTESQLYFRLNFHGADDLFYSSKEARVVDTDGVWNTLEFLMNADDFYVSPGGRDDAWTWGDEFSASSEEQFAAAITGIHEFKIVSNEEYPQWAGVDAIEATVGMDNFQTHADVSAVPVPAAAWLMISGLLGLGAFSSKKRKA